MKIKENEIAKIIYIISKEDDKNNDISNKQSSFSLIIKLEVFHVKY